MLRWLICLMLMLPMVANSSASTDEVDWITAAEALPVGQSRVLIDGETITFLYRAIIRDLDAVVADYGATGGMRLIDTTTNLWASTHTVPNLNEAILSYRFTELKDSRVVVRSEFEFWRGENALSVPPQSHPLRGFVREFRFQSQAMNETRYLTIYFPPDYDISQTYPVIYATSGQNIAGYLPYLDQLILDGNIPRMLVIAAHSTREHMGDYLPGYYPEHFAIHEQFFTQELRLWAEANLGASLLREERAVFGSGNGGVFAAAMALLHPSIYGLSLSFSPGMDFIPQYPYHRPEPNQRLYFAAGTLTSTGEEVRRITRGLSEYFVEAGAEAVYQERVASDSFYMWQEEFYHAVLWAFGE